MAYVSRRWHARRDRSGQRGLIGGRRAGSMPRRSPVAEHCKPRTLTDWRRRLGKSAAVPSRTEPRAVSFVEVVAPASSVSADVSVEVLLPAGYRLRLASSMTTALLQTVLTALEAPRMIPAHVRIFVCTQPIDFRRGFDGLALAARERLGEDPRAGGLLVFTNRRATSAEARQPRVRGRTAPDRRRSCSRPPVPMSETHGPRKGRDSHVRGCRRHRVPARSERASPRRAATGRRVPGGVREPEHPGLVRVAEPRPETLPPRGRQGVPAERGAGARAVPSSERPAGLREPSRLPLRRPLRRRDVPGRRVRQPRRRRGLYREQPVCRRQVHRRGLRRRHGQLPPGLPLRAGEPAVRRHLRDVCPRRAGGLVLLGDGGLHRAGELQSDLRPGHLHAAASPLRPVRYRRRLRATVPARTGRDTPGTLRRRRGVSLPELRRRRTVQWAAPVPLGTVASLPAERHVRLPERR
jgi:hypothetical protein